MPATFETARKYALTLDNVQEGTSYGTPALKVKGKLFARLRPELDALVLAAGFDERDALMAADPETFFITDHYLNYPWILVRLSKVRAAELRDLLKKAREFALTGRSVAS